MSSIVMACYRCGSQEPAQGMIATCVIDGEAYREPYDYCPTCQREWDPVEWCVECEKRIEDCVCVRCSECKGLSEECDCGDADEDMIALVCDADRRGRTTVARMLADVFTVGDAMEEGCPSEQVG